MDNIEDKKNNLEIMRQSFIALMNVVMQLPSAQIQKQQALLRFDEAHMWMQNGIMSYAAPVESVSTSELAEHHAIVIDPAPKVEEQPSAE